jgi:hypothetical protein
MHSVERSEMEQQVVLTAVISSVTSLLVVAVSSYLTSRRERSDQQLRTPNRMS